MVAAFGMPALISRVLVPIMSTRLVLTRRYQWKCFVRVDRQLCLRINHILAQSIPALHQRIQVITRRMHLHPSWMILWRRRFCVSHCLQSPLFIDLLVTPYPVRPHVCAVEVGFRGIKDHAVDCGLFAVLVVLYVFLDVAGRVDGEDVAVARIVVEGIAIYGVRWFLRRE